MIPIPLNTVTRVGLNVLLLLAGVVALHLGRSVFVPTLVALLLATVLGPIASWLHETLKIRWGLACITVVVTLIVANLLLISVFSASVMRVVNQLSDQDNVLKLYNTFRDKLEKVSPFELDKELLPPEPGDINQIGIFRYAAEAATPWIMSEGANYTAKWSWQVIIILFITFFVLLEGRMLARRAAAIFGPNPEVQAKVTEVLLETAKQVRTYLVWRTLINLVLAIVMGSVYQYYNLTQAWTWAILLAILNYIPYFGPVLASIPPFLDAFIFSEHPVAAVIVTTIFWVVIVFEGYLVVPLVMGRNMDLNATTVMLACLFWDLVWGTTGLFLAMPIMAGIKAILHHIPDLRPWANLMSSAEDSDAPPRDEIVNEAPSDAEPVSAIRE